MNKFIQYLKEKGYKIYGNKAVLLEIEFNICEGYKTTAMGKQKSYWLELVPNKRKEDNYLAQENFGCVVYADNENDAFEKMKCQRKELLESLGVS